ncbi:MAG: 30S ribosomal protein S17 [Dehalococcoidia bacterium]|nr:30S ribosomal protein S17 [Dehalococcoidia bacterium]
MGSLEKAQLGTVISNKMDKTVVVRVDRQKRHRLYGKTLRRTLRYKAHDEHNACRLGDIVRIAETRPLSREKRWRVVEVVTKGDVAEVAPREIGARIIEETRAAAAAEADSRTAEAATPVGATGDAEAASRMIADAVEAPVIAQPAEAAVAPPAEEPMATEPDIEIVDDTPLAPAGQVDALAEDAAATREEGEA